MSLIVVVLVMGVQVLPSSCAISALAAANQEQQDTQALSGQVCRILIAKCRKDWGRIPPQSLEKIKDVNQLVPRVGKRWPDQWIPVLSEFENESRAVFALPREALLSVRYGNFMFIPTPTFPHWSPVTNVRFRCRNVTVGYSVCPTILRDYLQTYVAEIAREYGIPDSLRQKVSARLQGRTELALRQKAQQLLASGLNYDEAIPEELYEWIIYAQVFLLDGGVHPSVKEITHGNVTAFVAHFGQDLLASKFVEYSFFVDGALHYRVYIAKHKSLQAAPRSTRGHEMLEEVHRSILTCGLRLQEDEEGEKD